MRKALPFVIIAAVLLATFGAGFLLMRPSSGGQSDPPAATGATPNAGAQGASPAAPAATQEPAKPAPVVVEPSAHVRGPANAPVTIEEFSDFQCPTCARMHPVVKQLLAKYPQQVRVVFRHYPLATIHAFAREAARAAEAAGMQGKFWEMADLLYEKQAEWSKAAPARPYFVQYAQQLGLDVTRFQQDIDGTAAAMRVVNDERRAASRRFQGTPTFVVNGRELKFEESNDLSKLSAAVERALAGQ
ncbi:MAG TPA: thioredoxin domain-containing protein [Pyrinomonadaceae bacterium]|nr:thioredoxin domain-containing protein [Pyrinomonadaceae bacterium]